MRTHNAIRLFFGLSAIFILSGCVVRTYPLTKDRVDQDLNAGNRGYLQGRAPASEEKTRKATRTTQAIEIELHSPIKFEKMPKQKPIKEATGRGAAEGNRGYITQSISPEIAEPAGASTMSFKEYTVQKNDTLQKISQKSYGTTKKWMKIYDANRGALKGPDKIYPGQVINIPIEPLKETKENLK